MKLKMKMVTKREEKKSEEKKRGRTFIFSILTLTLTILAMTNMTLAAGGHCTKQLAQKRASLVILRLSNPEPISHEERVAIELMAINQMGGFCQDWPKKEFVLYINSQKEELAGEKLNDTSSNDISSAEEAADEELASRIEERVAIELMAINTNEWTLSDLAKEEFALYINSQEEGPAEKSLEDISSNDASSSDCMWREINICEVVKRAGEAADEELASRIEELTSVDENIIRDR